MISALATPAARPARTRRSTEPDRTSTSVRSPQALEARVGRTGRRGGPAWNQCHHGRDARGAGAPTRRGGVGAMVSSRAKRSKGTPPRPHPSQGRRSPVVCAGPPTTGAPLGRALRAAGRGLGPRRAPLSLRVPRRRGSHRSAGHPGPRVALAGGPARRRPRLGGSRSRAALRCAQLVWGRVLLARGASTSTMRRGPGAWAGAVLENAAVVDRAPSRCSAPLSGRPTPGGPAPARLITTRMSAAACL